MSFSALAWKNVLWTCTKMALSGLDLLFFVLALLAFLTFLTFSPWPTASSALVVFFGRQRPLVIGFFFRFLVLYSNVKLLEIFLASLKISSRYTGEVSVPPPLFDLPNWSVDVR